MKCLVLALLLLSRLAHADDDEALYTCHPPAPGTKLRVTFKPETEIKDVITWVIGFSCKNIVVSSDVIRHAPRVTLIVPGELTPKQAMQLFVDAMDAADVVVVQKTDNIVLKLAPNIPRSCPDVGPSGPPTVTFTPKNTPPQPPAEDVDKIMDAGIKKVDETHYVIAPKVFDMIFDNPMEASKGARAVPAVKDGKAAGFKLYAVRPSSLFARIGLINGDTILTINGYDISSADKALEVYTKLRDATKLAIGLERRGKPVTIELTIK